MNELNLIEQKKTENINKIKEIEKSLGPKYAEKDIKYERMSMLENNIQSTEVEKKN